MPSKAPSSSQRKPTHFLALPLITPASGPALSHSLSRFADAVTRPTNAATSDRVSDARDPPQIPPSAIRPLGTLHFTLGVMHLPTKMRVEECVRYLECLDIPTLLRDSDCSNTSIVQPTAEKPAAVVSPAIMPHQPSEPLTISLVGLNALPSVSNATFLYASPSPLRPLRSISQCLRTLFTEAGFLIPDSRPMLLHATLVNTLYAKSYTAQEKRERGKGGKGKVKIDATELVKKGTGAEGMGWEDMIWAEGVKIGRVVVCEMGAEKVKNDKGEVVDEKYKEVGSVSLRTG